MAVSGKCQPSTVRYTDVQFEKEIVIFLFGIICGFGKVILFFFCESDFSCAADFGRQARLGIRGETEKSKKRKV